MMHDRRKCSVCAEWSEDVQLSDYVGWELCPDCRIMESEITQSGALDLFQRLLRAFADRRDYHDMHERVVTSLMH